MAADPRPLTVFAIPRAFERHFGIAQRNAIQSWLALEPRPRVILLGDDQGTAAAAAEFGCTHIADVARNEFGTPLLGSVFEQAHRAASGGLMLFINSDIILLNGASEAFAAAPAVPFMMTGRRTHLIVRDDLNFAGGTWRETLARRVARKGGRGGDGAMDYFLFPHGLYGPVPPFAIGRGWWDHWLAKETARRGAMLIDASDRIVAVHQDHGYLATEESVRNLALLGEAAGQVTLAMATHKLGENGLAAIVPAAPERMTPRRLVAAALRRAAAAIAPPA